MDFLKNNKLIAVIVAAVLTALTSFYLGVWGESEAPVEPAVPAVPASTEPVPPAQPQEQPVPNFGAPTDAPATDPAAPPADPEPATDAPKPAAG